MVSDNRPRSQEAPPCRGRSDTGRVPRTNLHPVVVVVLVLAGAACQRGAISSNPEPSSHTAPAEPIAPVLPMTSSSDRVADSASSLASPADECTPGQRIAPAALAASWPSRIGTRVRFRSRIEVAIDVMDAVATAAGHRFVVLASPYKLWEGEKERTFTVMGSKTVSLGGRTTLPQLLLEEECAP